MIKPYSFQRGTILISEVIFLILAIAFIAILFIFIARQSSNTSVIEEQAAKQIALAIDAAHSGMQITIHAGNILKQREEVFLGEPIIIDSQLHNVRVQLSERGGFSYGYFSDASVTGTVKGEYLVIELR